MEECVHSCSNHIHCVSEQNFLSRHQLNLFSPLASSMFVLAVSDLMAEFYSNKVSLASFVVSVYVLGFAFGPFLLASMSELYGRQILYVICTALFFIFTVACAVPSNLNILIAFRFSAGIVGVATIAIGGGSIANFFRLEKRGLTISLYVFAPGIGPVIGGFLSQAKGWRLGFQLMTIIVRWIILNCEFKQLLTWCLRVALSSCSRFPSCVKHIQPRSPRENPTD